MRTLSWLVWPLLGICIVTAFMGWDGQRDAARQRQETERARRNAEEAITAAQLAQQRTIDALRLGRECAQSLNRCADRLNGCADLLAWRGRTP